MTAKPLAKLTMKRGRQKSTAHGKGAWKEAFINSLRQMPNVAVACEAAHVSRATVYAARKTSAKFAKRWATACEHAIDKLEAYCWKRAAVGVKRGVWMKDADGNPIKVEDIAEVSDGLASFLLKAHRPEKYREPKQEAGVTVTTPTGETVAVQFNVGVTADELPQ